MIIIFVIIIICCCFISLSGGYYYIQLTSKSAIVDKSEYTSNLTLSNAYGSSSSNTPVSTLSKISQKDIKETRQDENFKVIFII